MAEVLCVCFMRQVTQVSTYQLLTVFYLAELINVWLNCPWVWSFCYVFSVGYSSVKKKTHQNTSRFVTSDAAIISIF